MVALFGTAIFAVALVLPTSFNITRTAALVSGLPALAISLVVVWQAHRTPDAERIHRLAFAQVLVATLAASLAVPIVTGRTFAVLMAMTLAFVYSGLVLDGHQHAIATGLGLSIATVGLLAVGNLTSENAAALLVTAGIALMSGVGAQMHQIQLAEREEAVRHARRTARALEAALSGIQASATTDRQRVLEAVTSGAARLADGPAAVYLLGEDGRLRASASHGIPVELASRAWEPHEGLVGRILQAGATRTFSVDADDPTTEMQRALGLHSVCGAPIRVNGVVVGVLTTGRADHEAWRPEEVDAFTLLADHAGRALELSQEAAADRRTMARLAELDRIKDDLVATVSHELRTPVTVITGLSETLATRPDLTADARAELVERLWANGVSLGNIVEQLLDATLLQRGQLVPVRRAVALRALVERTATRLHPLLLQHVLHDRVDASVVVDADPALLERVLENLFVNAVKHTPAGTNVTVEAAVVGTNVRIAVFDDGPGIKPADLPHVVERFARGGELNERARGLGIGLSLADEILHAHQSGLEVTSRLGEGARFTFVLPAASAAVESAPPDALRR